MQKSIPYGLNNSLYSLMKAPQGAFFIDRGRMAKTNPAQGENGVDMDEQHEDLDLHDDDHQEASPEEDWKAQARKWERRAKENQDAAQRLAEAEKRALEAEEQLGSLTSQNEQLQGMVERQAWVQEAAEKTGVPASVLNRVTAESADDLMEFAEGLAASMKQKPGLPVVSGDGERPQDLMPPMDANDWLRAKIKAR